MIITRTPFRFTLGGGGTDLPSYYSRFGGMVFAAGIDKYMFIAANRPIVDDLIRVKYSSSETVQTLGELKHELAKATLEYVGIGEAVEIISMADIPAGTGLGSSSCYMVGLLNALSTMKRDYLSVSELAEKACHIEMELLKKPIGKQDPYLAAYGGLPILEIEKSGKVSVRQAKVDLATMDELNRNTLLFFTGTSRSADSILKDQDRSVKLDDQKVTDSLHRIKEIGHKIIEAIEAGNIDRFGTLTHEHWQMKLKLSPKVANPEHLRIYEIAQKAGALGGKITGAGGGGFFVFYTADRHHDLRRAMAAEGLRELRYRFDTEGSKILVNLADGRGRHAPASEQLFWSLPRNDDHGVPGTC